MTRPNQTALGITTGDIVRTSYRTGPYEVNAIVGPELSAEGIPLIHLILTVPDSSDRGRYYINDVRRSGDGWQCGRADELYLTPKGGPTQLALFGALGVGNAH